MNREARREFNRDSFDLWLVTRGHTNSTGMPGHPDSYHGRAGKPGSRVNQDDYWIEATSTPDARATDAFFRRAIDLMELDLPAVHLFFTTLYAPDPAGFERVAERGDADLFIGARTAAITFVLDLADAERRLLYWPSPDSAKGYVERNLRKKRDALYMFHREREAGTTVTLAVRRASHFARCSRRAVYYWLAESRGENGAKSARIQG